MSTTEPLADDHAALVKAQAERDPESVGPTVSHGSVRRTTADQLDPHRAWTVQSGVPFPIENGQTTRFHPDELADPQKAVDAGMLPQFMPEGLVSTDHVTQPPTAVIPLDDPTRAKNKGNDPGYAASQATSVGAPLKAAQAAE